MPAGKRVRLTISPEGWRNLSPLATLAPDDIYELVFAGSGMSAEEARQHGIMKVQNAPDSIMSHVAGLIGLAFFTWKAPTSPPVASTLLGCNARVSHPSRFLTTRHGRGPQARPLKAHLLQQSKSPTGLGRPGDLTALEELSLGSGIPTRPPFLFPSCRTLLPHALGEGFTTTPEAPRRSPPQTLKLFNTPL